MRSGGKDDKMLLQFSYVSLVADLLVFNHLYYEVEAECCRTDFIIKRHSYSLGGHVINDNTTTRSSTCSTTLWGLNITVVKHSLVNSMARLRIRI